MTNRVTVSVPATTANLGPGFDAFGLALEMRSTYAVEVLSPEEKWSVHFEGMGADVLNEKGFKFVSEVMDYFERAESVHLPPLRINVQTGIPLTRGLGSSASAIVGLLSCFEVLMNEDFDTGKVLKYAIGIEGHPDNVTASLIGGFTIAASDRNDVAYMKVVPQNLKVIVTVPSSFLSTKKARALLPDMYSRRDAVFNISRASMLSACIFSGNYDLLSFALHDRLHERYREKLVTGFHEVSRAADRAGAYGSFLSGAGPSIAALADPSKAEKVAKAMQKAMIELDAQAETLVLGISAQGVILQTAADGEKA
ncbi:MAG: homoserine kinase [Caldiserica bacterium]|nr:homoserine kinase [Caldisericota bacterium]